MNISYDNTTLPPRDLLEILWKFAPASMYIDRCVTPIFYVVGIIGNTITAIIWLNRKMLISNSSAVYLGTLAITDLLFLLLHIVQELRYAWSIYANAFPVVCEVYSMVYITLQYLSPTLVLGFTVERYIAICHPFLKEQYCTVRRALMAVIISIMCCLLLGSMHGYFWTYQNYQGDRPKCEVRDSAMLGDELSLWSIWTWITELTVFLLLPLIILVFNCLVIAEVKRISSSDVCGGRNGASVRGGGDQPSNAGAATTVMLLSVSFYVIATTLPATLVYSLFTEFSEGNVYMTDDEIRTDPKWSRYFTYVLVRKITDEICLSHYACYFILYMITGAQFRVAFRRMSTSVVGKYRNEKYIEVPRHQQTSVKRV